MVSGDEKKVKRRTACHHCRKNHKKCTGDRPCHRCVSKNLECFDYDSSAVKSTPRRKTTSRSGSTPPVTNASTSSPTTSIVIDNESDVKMTDSQQRYTPDNASKSVATPASIYSIHIWGTSIRELHKATVLHDLSQDRLVIGCNEAFCHIFGYTFSELQSHFSFYQLLPIRLRKLWKDLQRWFNQAMWSSFSGCLCVVTKTGVEYPIRLSASHAKSHVTATIEITDYYTDQWHVNDIVTPESFRIENARPMAHLLPTAHGSYGYLVQALQSLSKQRSYLSPNSQHPQVDRLSSKNIFGGSSSSVLLDLLDDAEVTELKRQFAPSPLRNSQPQPQQQQFTQVPVQQELTPSVSPSSFMHLPVLTIQQPQSPPSHRQHQDFHTTSHVEQEQQQQYFLSVPPSTSSHPLSPGALSFDEFEQVLRRFHPSSSPLHDQHK